MYPLKFNNIYVNKIWGGREMEDFRDNLPPGDIGESWDVFSSDDKSCKVINGKYKDKSLNELILKYEDKIVGEEVSPKKFPLLVKIINAKQDLSVQVHPDDKYALKNENSLGKTEIWYVLSAKEDAQLVIGKKDDCSKEEFLEKLGTKEIEGCLKKVNVSEGDVYYIESGLIHAIGEGIMLAEIQQNSDITYRVYDYDRDRKLHIEDAKKVINFNLETNVTNGVEEEFNKYRLINYVSNKYFAIQKIDIRNSYKDMSDKKRFYIYTCVKGTGKIITKDFEEKISYGESIMIPASMGEYEIIGDLELLKTFPSI